VNLQSIENSVPELWTSSRHLEQLLSSGRHLYVDFIVDGRRQSNGFKRPSAGKSVSEVTYFGSSGTQNVDSINQQSEQRLRGHVRVLARRRRRRTGTAVDAGRRGARTPAAVGGPPRTGGHRRRAPQLPRRYAPLTQTQFTPPDATRRDATRQFCCVVLGGVSWVLNTYTRLTALFRGYPGEPAPER